ncbi:MAG: N-6 DNA methylase [Deltaproteobacteria bacterium]|nr:N-6 DNA methylase [Deltaproteobacteria bacterium]
MHEAQKNKLPRSGLKREALRTKGQFWTPDWVADVMAAYVLKEKPKRLLDPALGEGAFFRAAKRYAQSQGFDLALFGYEIDRGVIEQARKSGLDDDDLSNVEIKDFIFDPPSQTFPAITVNPPYIRHHRLSLPHKERLRELARIMTGQHIDGRAGLHVYFLIRALQMLSPDGKLAFIVSADICEGVFAHALWKWVCSKYRLEAVISFASEAAPFPDVDTNALVFLIRNSKPTREFYWIKCLERNSKGLCAVVSGLPHRDDTGIQPHRRLVSEALITGLSRPPAEEPSSKFTLGDFAYVMRGIVTGDNEFFFITSTRANELGIPDRFLVRAVGRIRDIDGESFDNDDLIRLENSGRPTYLLNLNGFEFHELPEQVRRYLRNGETRGLSQKTLIKTRKPWYRMETRKVPPILFAYLGRRNARFIRNLAGVVPLTCLLCVYPKIETSDYLERLWRVISHPITIGNLRKVGKSYGKDAIKVEPRALERLPLPEKLVLSEGLGNLLCRKQETLFKEGL